MSGKRYSDQTFGDIRAVLGAPVFVTTAKGELVGGHVHHITDESAAPGYRDRVFIAYVAGGGWDEDPRAVVKPLPFFDPKTRSQADHMPADHWCWPRTWEEASGERRCECLSGNTFAECHGKEEAE